MHLNVFLVCRPDLATRIADAADHLSEHTVQIADTTASPAEAVGRFLSLQPDVVVMDPSLDGGALLRKWKVDVGPYPVLICVSADTTYAYEAFAAGAVHFLHTSEVTDVLDAAFRRAVTRVLRYDRGNGNGSSARELQAPFKCKVIALPHATGIEIRTPDEVLSAHGEGNYTRIVLQDGPPMVVSRPIGEYEATLSDAGLVRVHRSHMVNVDHIRRVRRGKSPIVQLSNGAEIDVSDTYRDMLFRYLQIHSGRRHDRD